MPYYTVKEGEQLPEIVARECAPGVTVQDVLTDDKNSALFETRTAYVLGTGDPLWLPEPGEEPPPSVVLGTGVQHALVVDLPRRTFRLRLAQPDRSPIADVAYTLVVDGQTFEGKTDAEGGIEVTLPLSARAATLRIGGVERQLQIGGLQPLHWAAGLQARLLNLGYSPGPVDGALSHRTLSALKAFQADQGIEVTGHVDQPTLDKLKLAYGF